MSSFEPNKYHLRELLIYFFNLKKSAAEAHRLLAEAYGEAALSERSCVNGFKSLRRVNLGNSWEKAHVVYLVRSAWCRVL